MDNNLLFGVSLTASFLGGMVALFAPCCITFLFPSYLGTIFKERSRVVFLTIVFALGLGAILIPVALGFRLIVSFFDQYHTMVYLFGSLLMVLLGIITLFDVKLSLPLPHYTMPQKTTTLSTFLLGIFSGITSSCCAPVLFAAITLSSLSPTLLTSFIVAIVYVLGIVFPLFFLSLLYDKFTNQYLYKTKTKFEKPLKLLASATFILSGIIIAYLTVTGRISMESSMTYGTTLRMFIYNVSSYLRNPFIDLLLFVSILFLGFIVFKILKPKGDIK
ncbi:hypothetical protein HYW54_00035 [Candidatus Gottesmanbacteria bacterium]|nr:hypothetical protein [Candidatus Gottesmanbacteria bacterium]